jgi:hypothetical protein
MQREAGTAFDNRDAATECRCVALSKTDRHMRASRCLTERDSPVKTDRLNGGREHDSMRCCNLCMQIGATQFVILGVSIHGIDGATPARLSAKMR